MIRRFETRVQRLDLCQDYRLVTFVGLFARYYKKTSTMRLLLNIPFWHTILLLSLDLLGAGARCTAQINIGALHIVSGTTWLSNPETAVVLDNMDLQYDAGPALLNNIFRFAGQRINSIRGDNRPTMYAISLAKIDPGELTLNQAINVTQRINFESGKLDLNGAGLFMQRDALLTNENELSRLIGPFGGYVTIDAELNAPVAANPGNLGAFITSATDLNTVHIVRGHQVQNLTDSTQGIGRWFEISGPDSGAINAVLRFNYFDAESEGFPNDSLTLWQTADSIHWTDIGYTTRDATQKYVEKQGLNTLSRFTLARGGPTPILALNSVRLAGRWNKDLADLNWTSNSEYDNDHFAVERKYASETAFTVIAIVPTKAPGGTSAAPLNYTYTDSTVRTAADDISYRIHEIAKSGESIYSNVITLQATRGAEFIFKCYPTVAVGGQVYIAVGNMALQNMQYRILNATGRLVMGGTLPYTSQWLHMGPLSKGIYHLLLQSGDKKFNATIIK
jgi:hypothetical protein